MTKIDLQPHLTSSVVALAPLVADDWAGLRNVASDPMIWADHPAEDRWKEVHFRRFFEQALSSGGALAVRDATTAAIVGGGA